MFQLSRILKPPRKTPSTRTIPAILALVATVFLSAFAGCSKTEGTASPPASAPAADGSGQTASPAPQEDAANSEGEQEPVRPAEPKANIFDAKQTKVGDFVAGMKVTKISVNDIDKDSYTARVRFSGEATVTGTYTHHKDDEMIGCEIRFEVDEQSAGNLPREKSDTRRTWFVFENHDEAEQLLGPPGTEGRATVVIDDYFVNLTYSCEYNLARLVKASVEK